MLGKTRRPRRYLGATLVVAMLASIGSLGVGVLASTPASATPPTLHELTTVACNNTFNGTKFPLQYIVDSTPSANPVAPGDPFTVSFHVTAIVAASFLNGVYAAVGVNSLPITPDQVVITPNANATGPDVTTALVGTFTIPAPTTVPVTTGVQIDLGTVTGSYVAGSGPGPATFAIKGDAWAPSRSVTDGVIFDGSTTVTSASANFTISDIGATIAGTVIPAGATIASVVDAKTVIISAPAATVPTVVTDGKTTINSVNISSLSAPFVNPLDVGARITGVGIPAGDHIASVTSATAAKLVTAATQSVNGTNTFSISRVSASGITLTIGGDTLPSNQTEPAWTGSAKTLTNSGKQTYETATIASIIKATVVCMGGTWTTYPQVAVTPRSVTDGQATAGSTTITSATANFTQDDVGGQITGTGIPDNETLVAVTSPTTATMTTAATLTTTTGAWTLTPSGVPRSISDGTTTERSITDGKATNGSTAISSATANFSATDVGAKISGNSLAGGTTITVVGSPTTATISAVASPSTTVGNWTILPTLITSATANFSATDVGATITGTNIPAFDSIASVLSPTTVLLKTAPTAPVASGSWVITPTTNYAAPWTPPVGFAAVPIQASTSAPSVTTNPSNQTVTAGSNYSFSAAATGAPAPTVQWQVSTDGGSTFSNIPGATSTTLSAASSASDDGHQFRAVFTNSVSSATTTAATLTVQVAPQITTNPTNQSVSAGSPYSFSAAASGNPAPTVQWQVSTNGGSTFSNVSGATSTTLSGTAAASDDGHQFRAVFTNSVGSATTTAATLSVPVSQVAPQITTNPSSQTVVAGAGYSFSASATGVPAPTVQWQVSTNGGSTFSNIAGATSTTLSGTAAASDDGHQFRAVFTNVVSSATTTAATLTVQTAPSVTTNPSSQTVTAGSPYSFSAAASGNPAPTVQWQVSTDGGSTFSNIAGATSTTLSGTAAASDDGHQFRAVFTNSVSSATTTAATLTVQTAPSVTTNPSSQTVTAGSPYSFSAAASGNPAPTVQWQVSTDGGSTFSNIAGATSTTLSGTAAASDDGHQFRAVFTNVVSSATTTAATLTVQVAPQVTTNPSDQSVVDGQSFSFSAAASGQPSPTVQWQESSDGGATFTDIAGATSLTYSGTSNLALDSHQFQARFTNAAGTATTTPATLHVSAAAIAPAVTTNPSDQTVAEGQAYSFSAAASGSPAPTVQWQLSTDGGATFSDVPGATSSTLTGTASAGDDGDQFRAVFTNSAGSATTTAATLHVTTVTVSLSSSVNPTQVGQATYLTAQASSATDAPASLTGTMSFYDGSTLLGSKSVMKGKATLLVSKLTAGSHTLTAVYDRGIPFSSVVSSSVTQVVNPTSTTITLSTKSAATVYGEPVVVKAMVKAVAPGAGMVTTGSVSFYDDGELVATVDIHSGAASLPVSKSLALGDHSFTAVYSGSSEALGSSTTSAYVQTVSQASTVITITGDPFRVAGQADPIKASVKAVAPSTGQIVGGSVDFYDNGAFVGSFAVVTGTVSLPVDKTRSVGSHSFTAVYNGTPERAGSVAVAFVQQIDPADTATAIMSTKPDTTFGHAGSITATVRTLAPGSGTPTGTVTFLDDGVPIATVALDSTGKAAIPLASLSVGTHNIVARYDGSTRGNQSQSSSFMQIIR